MGIGIHKDAFTHDTEKTTFCIDGGKADTADSKSAIGNNVWVQVPLDAPLGIK